jgi:hypothetical protein
LPEQPTKGTAPLYIELPITLRERLEAFVKRTRRTLKGEVANAIEQYLNREEGSPAPAQPTQQAEVAPKGKRKGKKE